MNIQSLKYRIRRDYTTTVLEDLKTREYRVIPDHLVPSDSWLQYSSEQQFDRKMQEIWGS